MCILKRMKPDGMDCFVGCFRCTINILHVILYELFSITIIGLLTVQTRTLGTVSVELRQRVAST